MPRVGAGAGRARLASRGVCGGTGGGAYLGALRWGKAVGGCFRCVPSIPAWSWSALLMPTLSGAVHDCEEDGRQPRCGPREAGWESSRSAAELTQ